MFLILTISLLFSSISATTAQVPSPENVRITSQNMELLLKWDPPQNISERNLTYTAQYYGWNSYTTVCVTDLRSCDFTDAVSFWGVYQFRVRTELEGQSSEWVQTNTTSPEEINVISSPDVKLQSRKGQIEVDITDPVVRKGNLREIYSKIDFHVYYWTEREKKKKLEVEYSRVLLRDLTPKVRYCVEVKMLLGFNKTSLMSNETCVLNTENDDVPTWLIVVTLLASFLVVLVLVVLVFFAVMYSYRGVRFLCPKAKLPEHFKQYLSERPKFSVFLQNGSEVEECYHEVSIIPCPEDPLMCQTSSLSPTETSSRPEKQQIQEEKRNEGEHRLDCESTHRDVTPADSGETELLLK